MFVIYCLTVVGSPSATAGEMVHSRSESGAWKHAQRSIRRGFGSLHWNATDWSYCFFAEVPPSPPPPIISVVVPRKQCHWDDLFEEPEEDCHLFSPGDVCFLVDGVASTKDITLPRILLLDSIFPRPTAL